MKIPDLSLLGSNWAGIPCNQGENIMIAQGWMKAAEEGIIPEKHESYHFRMRVGYGTTALSFILMILLVVQEVKVSGHPSLLPIKEIGHRGTLCASQFSHLKYPWCLDNVSPSPPDLSHKCPSS